MKIILLGGTGLAGISLYRELKNRKLEVLSVARKNADIICDVSQSDNLYKILMKYSPDIVINAAAMVDISKCKKYHQKSWNINCRVPGIIMEWAEKYSRPFVQISTDHYYHKDGPRAHKESDPTILLNEYAKQKFAAESICSSSDSSLILRTNIVGLRGWKQHTFAEWAIYSLKNNCKITIFDDVWTSSIDTSSFAKATIDSVINHELKGLYNLGSSEVFSKADFILELANQLNVNIENVSRGSIFDCFNDRASSLGLDSSKIQNYLSWKLPGLNEVVKNLVTM